MMPTYLRNSRPRGPGVALVAIDLTYHFARTNGSSSMGPLREGGEARVGPAPGDRHPRPPDALRGVVSRPRSGELLDGGDPIAGGRVRREESAGAGTFRPLEPRERVHHHRLTRHPRAV